MYYTHLQCLCGDKGSKQSMETRARTKCAVWCPWGAWFMMCNAPVLTNLVPILGVSGSLENTYPKRHETFYQHLMDMHASWTLL